MLAHGIDIDELVLEPLASGEAVLTTEERQMGVVMADLGGGTTDLALFRGNGLWHTEVLDVGGSHMTNDVAIGLRAPFEVAEELKLRYGHLQPERIAEDEQVWATVFGDKPERTFSRRFISQILQARAEETAELIQSRIAKSSYGNMVPAGLVLTGGASQLPGAVDLFRRILAHAGAYRQSRRSSRRPWVEQRTAIPRLRHRGRSPALGALRRRPRNPLPHAANDPGKRADPG